MPSLASVGHEYSYNKKTTGQAVAAGFWERRHRKSTQKIISPLTEIGYEGHEKYVSHTTKELWLQGIFFI